jgi:Transposase DDE domain group 1
MRRSPRNLQIACDHRGLTHFGGIYFFHEFMRVLQLRHHLSRLTYPRRNRRYSLSQMILALLYPIVLGLDRLETASLLRSNGTFQYLTGMPSFPDPQTLRRFILHAPASLLEQLRRVNDRLLQNLIHLPSSRSRLIFDFDSTVLTVFGHQEKASVGYNPHYRGKRSYHPLLCMEANSSYLWGLELRPGKAITWDGSLEMLDRSLDSRTDRVREVRARADSGFGYEPVLKRLEDRSVDYAVVARLSRVIKRILPGLDYQPLNRRWEVAEFEHCLWGWSQARRFVVLRRLLEETEPQPTLFVLGRYVYRAWNTNLSLTPAGVWRFYEGRGAIEPRIAELRQDFALRKIPTHSFTANAIFFEIIRLAYNLVTAFQRLCLPEPWQRLTLQQLRYKLFLLPGELIRPQNRPVLRLKDARYVQDLTKTILSNVYQLKPITM